MLMAFHTVFLIFINRDNFRLGYYIKKLCANIQI